ERSSETGSPYGSCVMVGLVSWSGGWLPDRRDHASHRDHVGRRGLIRVGWAWHDQKGGPVREPFAEHGPAGRGRVHLDAPGGHARSLPPDDPGHADPPP